LVAGVAMAVLTCVTVAAPGARVADASVHATAAPPTDATDGWIVTGGGRITAFGGAPAIAPKGVAPWWTIAAAASPNGGGLWLLGADGRVVAAGSAQSVPSTAQPIWRPRATALASTPTGDGVWVLDERGGIRALGAAPAFAPVSVSPHDRAVALAVNRAGTGLWVVTMRGIITAVGAATPLPSPTISGLPVVHSFVPMPDDEGGWLVDYTGAVWAVGTAPAMSGRGLTMAATGVGSSSRLLTVGPTGLVTQRSTGGSTVITLRPLGLAVAVVSPAGVSPIAEPATGIPATTKVVDPSLVLGTDGDPVGSLTVRVPRAAVEGRRGLQVDDILAMGIGPNTPFGLLRRVHAITGPTGDSYALATTPALLSDAVPQGSIDIETSQQPVALDAEPAVSVRSFARTATESKGWSCRSDDDATLPGSPIQGEVSGTIDLDLSAGLVFRLDWSALEPVSGKLGVGASAGVTFTGTATGELQCNRELTLMEPRLLDPIEVPVGGVPVVVVPELGVNLTVSAGIAASAEVTITGNVNAEAGMTFDANGVQGYAEKSATGSAEVDVSVSASIGAETTLNTKALLYGIAGPQVELTSPSLELTVTACRTPVAELELSGKLSATLALASWLGGSALPIALEETLYEFTLWEAPDTLQTPAALCGAIAPPVLSPVRVGQDVDIELTATDVTTALDWEVVGSLPPGLSLVPLGNDGHIQGIPTTAGSWMFTVKASTATGHTLAQQYTLNVLAAGLSIDTSTLPAATMDVSYSAHLVASGATEAVTWDITNGSLPNGLTLNHQSGEISGTPTESGTFGFVVELAYASQTGDVAEKALGIVVNEPPKFAGTISQTHVSDRPVGSGCSGPTAHCVLDQGWTVDVDALEVDGDGGFRVAASITGYHYHYVVSFPTDAGGSGCAITVDRRLLDRGSNFAYTGTVVDPYGQLTFDLEVEESFTQSSPDCGTDSVRTRTIDDRTIVGLTTMVVRNAEGKVTALVFDRTLTSPQVGVVTQTGRLDEVD
jgi:Putative Ig domain